MKFISWNVNGLRALCRKQKSLTDLLQTLDADILCLQETKIDKNELTRDLAVAVNWESFFAFAETKTGYSGVATFCKSTTSVPFKAFTTLNGFLSYLNLTEEISEIYWEATLQADSEGRCVVTVHGDFILFNVYIPALVTETDIADRVNFKLNFLQVLAECVRCLIAREYNVILMGDFNCAPCLIDHCSPPSSNEFYGCKDRQCLLKLLNHMDGPCVDLFRTKAYSCWNQVTNARVNNYGSRIDLILAAESLDRQNSFLQSFTDAGIMVDREGSDHAPVWVERTFKEGLLPSIPEAVPKNSSKFLFQGKQLTLDAFLMKDAEEIKRSLDVALESSIETRSKRKKKAQQLTLMSYFNIDNKETIVEEEPLPNTSCALTGERKALFAKRKPPLCSGHHEPCVMKEVKKKGSNKGRKFYICSRAEGPMPIGRCDFFKWATDHLKHNH